MKHKGRIWILCGTVLLLGAGLLTAYNIGQSAAAGTRSEETAAVLREHIAAVTPETEPAAGQSPQTEQVQPAPQREMPTVEVDGRAYIGLLRIPELQLELPVQSQWSTQALQMSPCRYAGSAYQDDMVICAHNYAAHFGTLRQLRLGDSVLFTDVDGTEFSYQVLEVETLQPGQTQQMCTGDWDLTLFTCTPGGSTRLTIRCTRTPS